MATTMIFSPGAGGSGCFLGFFFKCPMDFYSFFRENEDFVYEGAPGFGSHFFYVQEGLGGFDFFF